MTSLGGKDDTEGVYKPGGFLRLLALCRLIVTCYES